MRITKCMSSECFSIIFLKCPKTIFLYPNASFNGTLVMGISKAAQQLNPPI